MEVVSVCDCKFTLTSSHVAGSFSAVIKLNAIQELLTTHSWAQDATELTCVTSYTDDVTRHVEVGTNSIDLVSPA